METIQTEIPYKINQELYKVYPPRYQVAKVHSIEIHVFKDTTKIKYTLKVTRSNDRNFEGERTRYIELDLDQLTSYKPSIEEAIKYRIQQNAQDLAYVNYSENVILDERKKFVMP